MKVKMIVSQCGPKISRHSGDIVEVSETEGSALIKGGAAVPVKSTGTEKAVINESEANNSTNNGTRKRGRPKKSVTD